MHSGSSLRARLMASVFTVGVLTAPMVANAADQQFNIAPQSLDTALADFSRQSMTPVLATSSVTGTKQTSGYVGAADPQTALAMLLEGTGLTFRRQGDTFLIVSASDPQSGSAAGDGADAGAVQALVVTAQKREENIQDVPIAMSAFTQEDLTRSQVAGGPDLMTQVPNFTFTKTNFSSYSIQIRGIGTQAISATVDPAVAVAFNNTPFIRNRFFEQEFYDLQRVEVLRGPQGTLYGRNATAGVVNIISAKPSFRYEAKLSADVANYSSSRLEGMVNVPIVEGKVALRLAGAWTKRDGYVTNQLNGNQIDGRDLWSTRLSLAVQPTDGIHANLIWEHFEENDDRLRSGKQLCMRDPGPTVVGGVTIDPEVTNRLSQGCKPASLYSPDSFQVPNGWALPYYEPLTATGFPAALGGDFYVNATQSPDLRVIESTIKPQYKAKTDTGEFQLTIDLTPSLTLTSETGYNSDELFSFEDYNRFNTSPGAFGPADDYVNSGRLDPNGVFCDPQLGCADRLVAADLSTSKSRQFSQELRLASNFDGPFNFSLGANFLRADSVDKYYVFINSLTLFATTSPFDPWQDHRYVANQYDNTWCLSSLQTSNPAVTLRTDLPFGCIYVDPNPISSLNDNGRNYFLSKNPYRLISYALFGEVQYDITSDLKFIGGLRWTVDKKRAPIIPSWLLTPHTYGLADAEIIDQEWREPTGRAVLNWKPRFGFTDETLVYGSYSHGYKAGGANPPLPANAFGNEVLAAMQAAHPPTFKPEFVNAYEVGTKNTLFDGRLTLNADTFYYDYMGYQISEIADRSAVNLNFDARVWGAELEMEWRPTENLRLGFKGGYEDTRLADGSSAVDFMDRTAGHGDWVVVKPFPIYPSNCVLPAYVVNRLNWQDISLNRRGVCATAYYFGDDPITNEPYTPFPYGPGGYQGFDPGTAPNGGAGFSKNLSGNSLPNAPHFTATLTGDYTLPLPSDWLVTLHSDAYYQSEAWTRVFNTSGYDKLKAFTNVNIAAIFANQDSGWTVMAYVKNVFDKDNITGAFLNSDDTGLTTNVFLNEPRLFGLRVAKQWTGGRGEWEGAHTPGAPYRFSVEVGGGVERVTAPTSVFTPSFVQEFSKGINPQSAQSASLDWSDSRDVKFTYTPSSGGWRLAADLRYGKANGQNNVERNEIGSEGCKVGPPYESLCSDPKYVAHPQNYGAALDHEEENFKIADFTVGKDMGLGSIRTGGRSEVEAGLRYAQFESSTALALRGVTDWYVQPEWAQVKYSDHNQSTASFKSTRRFKGAGPVISWDASRALLGSDGAGRVSLDWTLTGGVLFGKQVTKVASQSVENSFHLKYYQTQQAGVQPTSVNATPPVNLTRSTGVSAPVLGVSLGLSYQIERLKVSAGYRLDKAYNVLDAGIDQHKSYDRTIQGPYFKIAVGFGG